MKLLPDAYLWSKNRLLNFGEDPDYNLDLGSGAHGQRGLHLRPSLCEIGYFYNRYFCFNGQLNCFKS